MTFLRTLFPILYADLAGRKHELTMTLQWSLVRDRDFHAEKEKWKAVIKEAEVPPAAQKAVFTCLTRYFYQ